MCLFTLLEVAIENKYNALQMTSKGTEGDGEGVIKKKCKLDSHLAARKRWNILREVHFSLHVFGHFTISDKCIHSYN